MSRPMMWLKLTIVSLALLVMTLFIQYARAHDGDPNNDAWYRSLKQPDTGISCCGESDAYWADEVHVKDGKTYATITDDRDDAPLMRPHVPVGTIIEIPDNKLTWKDGNPTGHQLVFLSSAGYVYCFVQSAGG